MTELLSKNDFPLLKDVKKIIAVSSAKGGVGKSTIAATLARTLKSEGKTVGLLDADLYGPSAPILFEANDEKAKSVNKVLQPIGREDIKLMSFGFLLGDQSATLRGPMVARYVKHMLTQTQWDALDYLVIDFPPGTGDIPMTLVQTVALDGAFIITTPHELALADVERGVKMFRRLGVPILGIVENMSYLEQNGEKNYIFGQLDQKKIEDQLNTSFVTSIPVDPQLSSSETEGAFQKLSELLSA